MKLFSHAIIWWEYWNCVWLRKFCFCFKLGLFFAFFSSFFFLIFLGSLVKILLIFCVKYFDFFVSVSVWFLKIFTCDLIPESFKFSLSTGISCQVYGRLAGCFCFCFIFFVFFKRRLDFESNSYRKWQIFLIVDNDRFTWNICLIISYF